MQVLAELIRGFDQAQKQTCKTRFVFGQIIPVRWLFAGSVSVPWCREGAVSQGLGKGGPAFSDLEEFQWPEGCVPGVAVKEEVISPQIPRDLLAVVPLVPDLSPASTAC